MLKHEVQVGRSYAVRHNGEIVVATIMSLPTRGHKFIAKNLKTGRAIRFSAQRIRREVELKSKPPEMRTASQLAQRARYSQYVRDCGRKYPMSLPDFAEWEKAEGNYDQPHKALPDPPNSAVAQGAMEMMMETDCNGVNPND